MYENNFQKKIITQDELKKKKIKNLILCHGVFDVVHPGHIRHLTYGKNLGKVLAVSITSDRFVYKGPNRPMINEKLRSYNLAALEIVDYVLINDKPTAIDLIKKIKPRYFLKGFEYSNLHNSKTKDELSILKKNGGKILYSPSDVVFSSTNIIKKKIVQNYKHENLIFLIKDNKIKFDELRDIINSFKLMKVNVLGDSIHDQNIITNHNYTLNKTPTLSLTVKDEKNYIGGASIVALHLKNAGAKVNFFSFVGNDKSGKFISKKLMEHKINNFSEIFKNKTTNFKQSYYADNYNLLKVSRVNNQALSLEEINMIALKLKKNQCDINIFSDFRHGIFNKLTIDIFKKALKKNSIKVADSQIASRWGNILDFKNFDLIMPNEKEARFSLGDQDSNISALSRSIINKSKAKNMILKLGKEGAISVKKKKLSYESYVIPSLSAGTIDALGTGDAFLAYATLTYVSSKCLARSLLIGSMAAACQSEIYGNEGFEKKKILDKIELLEKNFSSI